MKKLFLLGITGYVIALALIYAGRIFLIYPFDPTFVDPKKLGLSTFRSELVASFDGTDLVVWSSPPKAKKPTVWYFHGNAGNLAGRSERFARLADRGYGVVAIAYRGSSGSQGSPDEELISKDMEYLRASMNIASSGSVIYYGESLGTGVAIKLANSVPPDALILEAPYTSLVDRAADQMPIFPVNAILDQRWETKRHIKNVDAPTLIIHGDQDKVVPISDGKTIFSISPARDKEMHTLKGRGHGNLWSVKGQRAIYNFIDRQ